MIEVSVGRRYEFLQRTKAGCQRFTALVTSIEERQDYRYVGFRPDDRSVGKWGFTRVYPAGMGHPYGIVPVKECE